MVLISESKKGNPTEDDGPAAGMRSEQKNLLASLDTQVAEIRESLERLTKSVGELNSKMRATGDVMKWVLDALSHRSEEKEVTYLKNLEASNEMIRSFMAFVESRVKPVARPTLAEAAEPRTTKNEPPPKEVVTTTSKKGEEYLVKPSLVRRFQEEEGKEKDKKSR
jgi:hypothetical protein